MTPKDLREAICRELAKLWPDRPIYPDPCPDDHARPSALVKVVDSDPQRANMALLRWSAKLLIVLWGELNDYELTDSDALMVDQVAAIATLMAAPLEVGDRYITVDAKDAGQDPEDGAAFVEVAAQWFGPASDLNTGQKPESLPLMEHFHLNFERS